MPGSVASKRYIALLTSFAVRDAKFAADSNLDDAAENWCDALGAEIYIGIFAGPQEGVLELAAMHAGTHPDNIRLVEFE